MSCHPRDGRWIRLAELRERGFYSHLARGSYSYRCALLEACFGDAVANTARATDDEHMVVGELCSVLLLVRHIGNVVSEHQQVKAGLPKFDDKA